jgi:hypothetical protein
MRIRQLIVMFVVMVATTLGVSGLATACKMCDPFLHCITTSPGALTCVEGPGTCGLFLQCMGGGRKFPESGGESLTSWSLFDAPAGGSSLPPRGSLKREAGDIAIGEDARASSGADAPVGALADAALAFGDAFALSFVDATGNGFAIQRSEEGNRVRLEVREVTNDVPGRVLASDVLGPRDALRVPVRVEGRDRLLLVQAVDAHGGGPFEVSRLRRSLAMAGRTLPPRHEALLRAHAR